jgi:hypothetical protein
MQPTPLRVDKIGAILASRCGKNVFQSISAARLMGNSFGGVYQPLSQTTST